MFLLLLVLCQSGLHYSLSLSLCKGKQKKGDFFSFSLHPVLRLSLPLPQTASPVAPFVLVVSYRMLGENATLSIPFEITFLVGCIQSGSGGVGAARISEQLGLCAGGLFRCDSRSSGGGGGAAIPAF